MSLKRNPERTARSGSTLDSFLEEEGIREEVEAVAIKRVQAWQIERTLQEQKKTNKRSRKFERASR
jgi:antitoxin HicB